MQVHVQQVLTFCACRCLYAYSANTESIYIYLKWCTYRHNLICVQPTFSFFSISVLNAIIPAFFSHFEKIPLEFQLKLIQERIAQDVVHKCLMILLYSSVTTFTHPIPRGVREGIGCLELSAFPCRQYSDRSLHRSGTKFLLVMLHENCTDMHWVQTSSVTHLR